MQQPGKLAGDELKHHEPRENGCYPKGYIITCEVGQGRQGGDYEDERKGEAEHELIRR